MNYELIKKFLFNFEPEIAHSIAEFTFKNISNFNFILEKLEKEYFITDSSLKQNIFNREFLNPVGIAAGFDKNGTMIEALTSLGFGSIEVGTVTPKPQAGNDKPRLFRHPKYDSLQNAMGFNNHGADKLKKEIEKLFPYKVPIGVNIGKNKLTSEFDALNDYKILINEFKDLSDYLIINISSPNTPNLRDLQNETFLKELFSLSKELTNKPILLKIAPDIDKIQAIKICTFAIEAGASGIIATNTTIDYSIIPNAKDFGGISGRVLKEKSFNIFKSIAKELITHESKPILISVGGIDSPKEAYRRIKNGANLIQIYTSFIYGGPKLIREINEGLIRLLKEDGFSNISEAVGIDL